MPPEGTKIAFKPQTLVYLAGIIFAVGGGWWALDSFGKDVEKLKTDFTVSEKQQAVLVNDVGRMAKDIQGIQKDVGTMKSVQTEQHTTMKLILAEIRRNNGIRHD